MTRTTVELKAHDVCNYTITGQIRPADDQSNSRNLDTVMIIVIIIIILEAEGEEMTQRTFGHWLLLTPLV